MLSRRGLSFSKWAGLLLAGDILVFASSVFLGYLLGSFVTWEKMFYEEHGPALLALGSVYLIILYIGELYNYYLDFRERENIGQVILWALAAAFWRPSGIGATRV